METSKRTIQPGETLWSIAKGDNKKLQAIINANKDIIKNPDKIYAGDEIIIPFKDENSSSDTPCDSFETGGAGTQYTEHSLAEGETIWGLAGGDNKKIIQICKANNINIKDARRLKIGTMLKIPDKNAPADASKTEAEAEKNAEAEAEKNAEAEAEKNAEADKRNAPILNSPLFKRLTNPKSYTRQKFLIINSRELNKPYF